MRDFREHYVEHRAGIDRARLAFYRLALVVDRACPAAARLTREERDRITVRALDLEEKLALAGVPA